MRNILLVLVSVVGGVLAEQHQRPTLIGNKNPSKPQNETNIFIIFFVFYDNFVWSD